MVYDNTQIDETMYKQLKSGCTTMLILSMLYARPMYVLEIIKKFEELSEGAFKYINPYDLLFRLSKVGYVDLEAGYKDSRKRYMYSITDQGRIHYICLRRTYKKFKINVRDILVYADGEVKAQMEGAKHE